MKKRKILARLKTKRRLILAVAVISLLILFIFQTQYSIIRAIGVVVLLASFYFLDHFFELDFERRHYILIIIVAFISFPLGQLYVIYPSFDKFAHFFEPIIIASLVFFMVDKLKLKLKWKLFLTFFVVVGATGLFEMGEYALDTFFGFRLQGVYHYNSATDFFLTQSKIDDTMIDLALGAIGTFVYVISVALFGKEKVKLAKP